MNSLHTSFAMIAVLLACGLSSCTTDDPADEHGAAAEGRGEHDRDGGEHDRDGGEHGGDAGEESGVEFALTDTYDQVRNGARLILAYDAGTSSFVGKVQNTTDRTLARVRVEVHLSNGKELGPTTPVDLAPGAERDVELKAASTDFERWTAHPEVGSDEHGGEVRGEHR